MSQIIQRLDQQQLKSLCGVVAHTSEGLTKSELTTLLGQCGICAVDDGSSRNQLGYTIGLNKRDWLYNCLVTEINRSQSFSKVFSFLQAVLNPASYTLSLIHIFLFGAFQHSCGSSLKLFCPVCFRHRFRLLGFVWDGILYIKSASDRVYPCIRRFCRRKRLRNCAT